MNEETNNQVIEQPVVSDVENKPKKLKKGKPETDKKKPGFKKILIIIIVAVLLIGAAVGCYFIFFAGPKSKAKNYPAVYVEDDKLIAWYNGKKYTITATYSTEDNSYLKVVFANNDPYLLVYENDDSVFITNYKKDTREKISSNGLYYGMFTPDDKYLLYEDDDDGLYLYEVKTGNKEKISSSTIGVLKKKLSNNTFYYGDGDSNKSFGFYEYNISKKEKKKIDSNVYSVLDTNDDNYLYYAKEDGDTYNLYKYNIKNENKDKIVTGMYSIYANDEHELDQFIYTKISDGKLDILDDDELDNDPETEVTTICTYSLYSKDYCTRQEWYADAEITYTDSKKSINDAIRAAASEYELYDIYYFKDGKSKVLTTGALSVYKGNDKLVLFSKVDDSEKVKISTLKSLDEFKKYVENTASFYYQNVDKTPVKIKYNDEKRIVNEIYIKDDIYIIDEDYDLFFIEASKNSSEVSLVDTNISLRSYPKFIKDEFIYAGNYNSSKKTYKLNAAKKNKTTEIADDVFSYSEVDNVFYYYQNCNSSYECDFVKYNSGKSTIVANEVYYMITIGNNKYYVAKNHSISNDTSDLYYYDGKKYQIIAYDVKDDYNSIFDITY